MNGFLSDLRFGLRQLRAKPGFAAAAILTLALGIGANTAVFSFLSGYLLKPLPYPHGEQLAQVGSVSPKMFQGMWPISPPTYRVIKEQTDAFQSTAYYHQGIFDLQTGGRAERVFGLYSTPSLFDVLGVQPLIGRTYTAENMQKGNEQVVLLSYGMWRRSFGADPNVVGKTLKLDGSVWRVIGVMPKDFAFPDRTYSLWVPNPLPPQAFSPQRFLALGTPFIGRLKPGVSLDTAKLQVQHAVRNYVQDEVPADLRKIVYDTGYAIDIQSWRQVLLGDRSSTLWLLQGAVLLILLMTCVNVANLLLSRILGRSHEIAVRSTLGATRAVLARQLLGEALCLTVPGGLIGVALCWLALHFITGSSLGANDAIFSATLDWRVGLFALGVVLFTAALVSVLPIRHLARTDLQAVLQEGGRTTSGGRGTRRVRSALVVAELTLATGLLAMAGLVLHSFINLQAVDPGFRKDHVLMASLLVPPTDHKDDEARSRFYMSLIDRVETLPGVRRATIANVLPLGSNQNLLIFSIPGQPPRVAGKPPAAMINNVSQGYFDTLGIPILRGKGFSPRGTGTPTAIIDAGLAEKYFHDTNPIGRQVQLGGPEGTRYTITGIVPSIKYAGLSQTQQSVTIYINDAKMSSGIINVAIHTTLPPNTLVAPLQNLVATVDPNVAVYNVRTMKQHLADSLGEKRTMMTLLLSFGGIALALAIVGVYAVMSYAVGQRRAECGVRLALGALPEDLSRLVLNDGLRLLVPAVVIGLGLAVLCGNLISARLFGVPPFDPLTLAGSAIAVCLITLAACWLPARRAAKLDPTVAIMEQ